MGRNSENLTIANAIAIFENCGIIFPLGAPIFFSSIVHCTFYNLHSYMC